MGKFGKKAKQRAFGNSDYIEETHTNNYCLNCFSANDNRCGVCPKCGSRRQRAYLKDDELAKAGVKK